LENNNDTTEIQQGDIVEKETINDDGTYSGIYYVLIFIVSNKI